MIETITADVIVLCINDNSLSAALRQQARDTALPANLKIHVIEKMDNEDAVKKALHLLGSADYKLLVVDSAVLQQPLSSDALHALKDGLAELNKPPEELQGTQNSEGPKYDVNALLSADDLVALELDVPVTEEKKAAENTPIIIVVRATICGTALAQKIADMAAHKKRNEFIAGPALRFLRETYIATDNVIILPGVNKWVTTRFRASDRDVVRVEGATIFRDKAGNVVDKKTALGLGIETVSKLPPRTEGNVDKGNSNWGKRETLAEHKAKQGAKKPQP